MTKTISILILLLFFSCKREEKEPNIILLSEKIELNKDIENILKQFINENKCKNCLKKLYIDKVYDIGSIDYRTIITIQQIPYKEDCYKTLYPLPIMKLLIDSNTFYLYSGIEDYLKIDIEHTDSAKFLIGKRFVNWTVIHQKDSFFIDKKGDNPFSPFLPSQGLSPRIQF